MNAYYDLIEQYNNLTDEEKNAIMVYKTRLFIVINSVTKIDDYKNLSDDEILSRLNNVDKLEEALSDYNKVLNLPENMFIKFSIFGGINLNSLKEFIPSIRKIDDLMSSAFNKIVLKDDLVVYRGLTSDSNFINLNDSGSIISTSIKIDDAYNFLNVDNSENKYLFVLNLKRGMNVLVCPYNIVRTYQDSDNAVVYRLNGVEPNILKVMNIGSLGQEEIMLKNSECLFNNIDTKKDNDILINFVDVDFRKDVYGKSI